MLLAFALLGVSVLHGFKEGLRAVGTPWLMVIVIPSVLIGLLAKNEHSWIPDEARRRFWARSIVVGAIMLCVVLSWIKAAIESPPTEVPGEQSTPTDSNSAMPLTRPRGPSGK
jgi:hypothetical protein